jgi:hypothetical protein
MRWWRASARMERCGRSPPRRSHGGFVISFVIGACRATKMPTVKEAYVFHMVMDDLYNDGDLDDAQRLEVRNAMFDGETHCAV